MMPNKTLNPQALLGDVVNGDMTTLDVGKDPPKPVGHSKGLPDIKTRHDPFLPHQIEPNNRIDITNKHCGSLNVKNLPMTPSKTMSPQALYDEVVNDNVTAFDAGENTPNLSADVIKNIEEAVSAQSGQTHVFDDQEQVRGDPKSHQLGNVK